MYVFIHLFIYFLYFYLFFVFLRRELITKSKWHMMILKEHKNFGTLTVFSRWPFEAEITYFYQVPRALS